MTYPQMALFWEKGQERIGLESELMQAAVREGVVDVAVSMKWLKRSGSSGRKHAQPQGMAGKQLELAVSAMAITNPPRKVKSKFGGSVMPFHVEVR